MSKNIKINHSPNSSSPKQNNHTIYQQPYEETIIHRQPFYICFKVDIIKFTQGTIFDSIIKRIKSHLQKQNKHNQSQLNLAQKNDSINKQSIISKTNPPIKILFKLEIYELKNNHNRGQQRIKISQTQSIGQIQPSVRSSRIYQYSIELTQILLKNKTQLNAFIYHFSPHDQFSKQYSLNLIAVINQKQVIQVGQCRIDPRVFIQIFLDQGVSCLKDSKQIFKQIKNGKNNQKQIKQNIQIQYEIYVQRNRLVLERILNQNKKGIKVLDFKEHIRSILQEREKQQEGFKQREVNIDENQNNKQTKVVKKSTKEKYNKYLKMDIEANLQYFNPQRQLVEKQLSQILKNSPSRAQISIQTKNKSHGGQHEKKDHSNSKTRTHSPTKSPSPIKKQLSPNKNQNKKNIIKDNSSQDGYSTSDKIKIAIFIIVSIILLYWAMTPSRNTYVPPTQNNEI